MVLSELTEIGSSVLKVTATDEDEANVSLNEFVFIQYINDKLFIFLFKTPNSEIIYTLLQLENNPFYIDQNTGALSVQSSLDYELRQTYEVTPTLPTIKFSHSTALIHNINIVHVVGVIDKRGK